MRTDLSPDITPWGTMRELEGFLLDGGRLVKPEGLTPINTTRFAGRITAIGEWKRQV